MSGFSVRDYFPWCRVKVSYQNVHAEPRSAMVRLEPDERYRPLCHECGQPARCVHSHARRFIRDLDFGDTTLMLQLEYRKVWCDRCGGVRAIRPYALEPAGRLPVNTNPQEGSSALKLMIMAHLALQAPLWERALGLDT